jgi:hypothetical protein
MKEKICKECGIVFYGRTNSACCSDVCSFWSRLDKSGGDDACWLWRGYVNPQNGYGYTNDGLGGGNPRSVHRRAYCLHHGVDPGELHVLHKCDVRRCGNPNHLFLGTPLDNWLDAVEKGRAAIMPKLTMTDVLAIRRSAAQVRDLVEQYQVSGNAIREVRRRLTWRHLPDSEAHVQN